MGYRIAGVCLLVGCLIFYDPNSASLTQRLAIPAMMALGAWGLVQNLAAVAIGVTVLAGIHSDIDNHHWLDALGYPAITIIAGLTLTVILLRRFRQRIRDTHAQRWRNRQPRTPVR